MSWTLPPVPGSPLWSPSEPGSPSLGATSSAIPVADECCSGGCGMGGLRQLPSGMMPGRSTGLDGARSQDDVGEVGLTSSWLASPANRIASQGADGAVMMSAICGLRCGGALASYDPDTSSWRTPRGSSPTDPDCVAFVGSWPRRGMTRSGCCYPLRTAGPRTSANGSGCWPTPTRSMQTVGDMTRERTYPERRSRRYPTPTRNDAHNNGGPSQRRMGSRGCTPTLNAVIGGPINPEWEERLMGFPPGWTRSGALRVSSWDPLADAWVDGWGDAIPIVANPRGSVARREMLGNAMVPQCVARVLMMVAGGGEGDG